MRFAKILFQLRLSPNFVSHFSLYFAINSASRNIFCMFFNDSFFGSTEFVLSFILSLFEFEVVFVSRLLFSVICVFCKSVKPLLWNR